MSVEWRELDAETPGSWTWNDLPASGSFTELGISSTASAEEIHSAYRALLLQHHPDRAQPADREAAEERTKRITLAYRAVLAKR